MAVYDPEDKEKDLDQLSPEELGDLEQKYSTRRDEREDKALEEGADEEKLKRGGMGRKLRKHGESADEAEQEALETGLGKELNDAKEEDKKESGFYKGDDSSDKGLASRARLRVRNLTRNKWVVGGAGAGVIGLIVGGLTLFSFLNVFKLEHLLDNIDGKAFARVNATFDNRSDKWIRAYMTIRLMEYRGTTNPGQDNLFFKADKVDTNKPLSDWYRTLRTSKFEQDLFEKNNIKFVSVIQPDGAGGIKITPGSISVKDDMLDFDPLAKYDNAFIEKVVGGDLTSINQLGGDLSKVIDQEFYKDNKTARRAIKTVVNDNTNFLQVFRRRHLRKDIQNKIGVSDWKFFEKTRTKLVDKKTEVQKKLLRKLLPEDTKGGKFLLCIFGAGPCPRNADSVNPETKSKAGFTASGTESEGAENATDDQGHVQTDKNGKPIQIDPGVNGEAGEIASDGIERVEQILTDNATEDLTNDAVRAELLKPILEKVNFVTGAISVVKTMDTLSRIDHNITTGKLSKIAVLAKGAQAAAAYTTYAIMRDQARSGELTADEYNLAIQTLRGSENSEAYDTYFNQPPGAVSAASSKAASCDDTHVTTPGEYFWNCDSTQIGGTTNGSKIENAYANSIGSVLHPLSVEYQRVRSTPGIKQLFDFANWVSGQISGVVSKITDPIFEAAGINSTVDKALAWISVKVIAFLGAGPILTGVNDLSGLTLTMIGQGAPYMAETSTRDSGAPISNPISKAFTDKMTVAYLNEQEQNKSLKDQYLALSNPTSVASKSMYALSSLNPTKLGSFTEWFGGLLSSFGSIFSKHALAQTGSNPAAFAGIDTFDFPPQCIDRDPMTLTSPTELTNADNLTNESGKPFLETSDVTMDLLDNQDAFWAKVYERVGDNDTDPTTVMNVYNCETLDQRVRGSLGNVYGYSADGGLEDAAVGTGAGGGGPVNTTGPIVMIGDSLTVGMQTLANTYPSGNYLASELLKAGRDTTVSAQGCRGLYQSAGAITGDGSSCPSGTIIDGFAALDEPATQTALRTANSLVVALGTNATEFVNGKSDNGLFRSKMVEYLSKARALNPNVQIFWVNLALPGATTRASERNQIIQEVAGSYRVTVLDWQTYVNTVNGDSDVTNDVLFNADGVHHGADGYQKKAQFIIDSLSGSVQ